MCTRLVAAFNGFLFCQREVIDLVWEPADKTGHYIFLHTSSGFVDLTLFKVPIRPTTFDHEMPEIQSFVEIYR